MFRGFSHISNCNLLNKNKTLAAKSKCHEINFEKNLLHYLCSVQRVSLRNWADWNRSLHRRVHVENLKLIQFWCQNLFMSQLFEFSLMQIAICAIWWNRRGKKNHWICRTSALPDQCSFVFLILKKMFRNRERQKQIQSTWNDTLSGCIKVNNFPSEKLSFSERETQTRREHGEFNESCQASKQEINHQPNLRNLETLSNSRQVDVQLISTLIQ